MSCACWVLATSNAQTYAGHALMAYSDFVAPVSFSSAPSIPNRNNMDSQWFNVNRIIGTHLA